MRTPKLRKVLLALLAAVLLLGVGLFVVCRWSPRLLTIDSGACRAGAIVVLGGDTYSRPIRAAELFRSNAAPVVIASGEGDTAEFVAALKQHGVPERAIWTEEKSGNTKQNAEFSVALLRKAHVTNAIVVTSWYHSRRALNTFRKAAPDIRFYSRPSYWGVERSMWLHHRLGLHITAEYPKLIWYWARYDVKPF